MPPEPPSESPPEPELLSQLRSRLDTVDRDLMQLLAERMVLVDEIAAHKRRHGLRIRDPERERIVLEDRAAQARALRLPPDVIESIFRLVLLSSRARQAALRTEVPRAGARKTVAIIGASGAMGGCMARLFAALGHTVLAADRDTALSPRTAAERADVVVLSVPIRATAALAEALGPVLRPDALLMDVTSLKAGPMQAMLAHTQASVLGTHPMFGPGVHSLQGQRIVLCPGRGEAWQQWAREAFAAVGLEVTLTTAEEHDRVMAVVQVLNHFQTQVLGIVLSRFGVSMAQSLAFTSPAYLVEAYVTARHFAQSPELYGAIEMLNPSARAAIDLFCEVTAELARVIEDGDQAAFAGYFQQVRAFFGAFTEEALTQSRFLVDRLVELSTGRSTQHAEAAAPDASAGATR